ncbi:SNF2 family N-terminal domain-containing protein [Gamsiella multidivaricata]|uniref:SNF2 family N-terminal domain-containing protein n=1 Tax=Gamsiella multidivaricata TaxID=101098 RepID=UPI002220D128|nr:SNF2 family N-terminal domain-containing protein [Gamsiella multidivaricata]KAI7815781.1 SNF2 family N-terminal domain-containing protein [Gamsiella multidivaricata]
MQRNAAPSQTGRTSLHSALLDTDKTVRQEKSQDNPVERKDGKRPEEPGLVAIGHGPSTGSRTSFSSRPMRLFKPPLATSKASQFKSPLRFDLSSTQEPQGGGIMHSPTFASSPMVAVNNAQRLNKRASELSGSTIAKHIKLVGDNTSEVITASSSSKSLLPKPRTYSTASFKTPSFSATTATSSSAEELCFNVLWRKKTYKKHKTWDGDGILVFNGSSGLLKDMEGKDIAKGIKATASELKSGDEISFGGKDIEIVSNLVPSSYRTGRCFMASVSSAEEVPSSKSKLVTSTKKFKTHPLLSSRSDTPSVLPQPRHNPDAPNATILPRPSSTHPRVAGNWDTKRPSGKVGLVDVVVDPILAQHLRPHQKEGVRFLYECMMQMKSINGQGAILADEMGLGKTLQTIALLWTLLKQSPYSSEESSVVKRALVVCPATLIQNWKKEFKKWLGVERLRVFAVDSKSTMTDFTLGKVYPVMIIGYEKLRAVQDELKNANFDIIICDEGHRLKTANIKTAQAIRSLPTKRRIILSGTPIQNDLSEFFSMIDFVNPGLFDSYSSFKRIFEDPIVRSRQPDCSRLEAALGLERSQELSRLTSQFILRRTAQVIYEFLPEKSEFVIFCRPSPLQRAIYRRMLDSPYLQSCFSTDTSRYLTCILALRKLCNSPKLVSDQAKGDSEMQELYSSVSSLLPFNGADLDSSAIGGKLSFVVALLESIKMDTTERVVLVSNFTQTLDILEAICTSRQYGLLRLDGSTPTQKRQEFVDKFNAPSCQKFIFLLSAKSGGVGLNLVGASRLILFDIDWNPSTDLQAMARIHRDGQTRPVFIYRLLSSGTIEEKMYQRQLTKVGLSDALMDGKATENVNKFSMTELRDLFTLHEDESCQTHSLLGCKCGAGLERRLSADLEAIDESTRDLRAAPGQGRSGIMDKASALLAKKELDEWAHVDVQVWRTAFWSERPGGEGGGEIDPGLDELANKDKVLWSTIMGSEQGAIDKEMQEQEVQEIDHGSVTFVFFKSGNRLRQ